MSYIAENLHRLREDVGRVAAARGRDPGAIRLVAVSKTFSGNHIREAFGAGQADFGENYTQEFRKKAEAIQDLPIRWHFIGHLQSNKAKEVVGRTFLIHSLDRESLARELQKRAERLDVTVSALIEVHTTDEATKSGVAPSSVTGFAKELSAFDRIKVTGLMTMGPFSDDPEDARPCFRLLRELRDTLRQEGPASMNVEELSMGMSSDHRVAVEEGATLLRIGTAIFGNRTLNET